MSREKHAITGGTEFVKEVRDDDGDDGEEDNEDE